MKLIALSAAALAFLPLPAVAQNMNAETFYKRAMKLQSKGPAALFSMGEIKKLQKEGQAAGLAARDRRLAAVKAGQKPAYCPPEGQQTMNSDEFMKRLSAIPAAERARIDMAEAMIRILKTKYPCPA